MVGNVVPLPDLMSLNATHEMAQERPRVTGESTTEAATDAVRQELMRVSAGTPGYHASMRHASLQLLKQALASRRNIP